MFLRCVFSDFAYVARDRTTRKHMCHVFRCDMPARTIANTLRDICKKIMIERSLQQNLGKTVVDSNGRSVPTRPCNLPTEHRRPARNSQIFVCEFSYVNWSGFCYICAILQLSRSPLQWRNPKRYCALNTWAVPK